MRNRKIINFGLALVALALTTGCSHSTPFISGRADFKEINGLPTSSTLEIGRIKQRVILIGDAGAPRDCAEESPNKLCDPTLIAMSTWAADKFPESTFSIFLGDNVYPDGVTGGIDAGCSETDGSLKLREAKRRLELQVKVLKDSESSGVFVPGNHDWGGGKGPCYEVLNHQVSVLREWQKDVPGLHITDIKPVGCPGPYKIDLEGGIRIIVFDSQWWLTDRKPTGCASSSERTDQLREFLPDSEIRSNALVVSHHPFATHGTHGGFYDWKAHFFPLTDFKPYLYIPLPIIGSLYPLSRKHLVQSNQDMDGRRYIQMRNEWASVYATHAPFIHAAGHDHNLQVLTRKLSYTSNGAEVGPDYVLVSGAGSEKKVSRVGDGDDTLFAHAHSGFMVVDFFDEGPETQPDSVLLRIIEPKSDNGKDMVAFTTWLRGGPVN